MAGVAAFSLLPAGCASVIGVQDTEVEFPVLPAGNGTFFGWNEITIDQDANSVNGARLLAVTLDVTQPAGTPDLSFLQSIRGETVLDGQRTLVATAESFPRGEQAVIMDVAYDGDLRHFFKDGHTIRLEWTGKTNPAYANWPSGGFVVRGRIKVDIE